MPDPITIQNLLNEQNVADKIALATHSVLSYKKPGEQTFIPIGLVRNVTVMQDPDVRRQFQIGSKTPLLATGIVVSRIQIGRIVGVYSDGVKTFLDLLAGSTTFDNTVAFDFKISHYDGEGKEVSSVIIRHCVISNYTIAVNAGDTFVMENVVFEAAKVEKG